MNSNTNDIRNASTDVDFQKVFKNWKIEQQNYKSSLKNYIIKCKGETQSTSKNLIPVKIYIRNVIKAYMNGFLSALEVNVFFRTLYTELIKALNIELSSIKTSGYAFMNPTDSTDPLFLPLLIVDWLWLIDQETEGIHTNLNDQVEDAKFKTEKKSKIVVLAKELMKGENFIPEGLMKERFEVEMLEAIGLINSSKLFTKKSARINTSLLYKQTKFNLLREESEGYAKLITEITTNMYTFSSFGMTQEEIDKNEAILKERVHLVLTNIKSLIGYFALDPNRVLDIILDIFIANVILYHRFFIDLLKASPWKSIDCSNDINNKDRMDIDEDPNDKKSSISELRGRTSNGQILGNKFAYYQDPESSDNASFSLYMVAALLIKNNLVNLNDLYPHLAPENDSMDEEYAQYLKEVKKNTERETEPNPLLSAGSLSDDTVPSDHKKSKDDNKDKEEKEDKEK